jgi:hypothetical protein
VKEARAMRAGHLLKRAGREFVRNLLWMVVDFGPLAAILIFATSITLVGALPFVGIFVCAVAAIITVFVLWSGAHDETLLSGNRGTGHESGHHSGGTYYPGFLDGGGAGDGGSGADGGGGGGW